MSEEYEDDVCESCMKLGDNIVQTLSDRCDDEDVELFEHEHKWTLADLFIRQWLNNMCDGFGLHEVRDMFMYICYHKDFLVANEMISRNGTNNSGYPLWTDWDFDKGISSGEPLDKEMPDVNDLVQEYILKEKKGDDDVSST